MYWNVQLYKLADWITIRQITIEQMWLLEFFFVLFKCHWIMKRHCMTMLPLTAKSLNKFEILRKKKNQSPFSTHDYRHISSFFHHTPVVKKNEKISSGKDVKRPENSPTTSKEWSILQASTRRNLEWGCKRKKDGGEGKKAKQQLWCTEFMYKKLREWKVRKIQVIDSPWSCTFLSFRVNSIHWSSSLSRSMRAIKNATDNGEHSQFTLNAKALIMQFSFVRKGSGKAPCYIYKNHAVLMENRVSEWVSGVYGWIKWIFAQQRRLILKYKFPLKCNLTSSTSAVHSRASIWACMHAFSIPFNQLTSARCVILIFNIFYWDMMHFMKRTSSSREKIDWK